MQPNKIIRMQCIITPREYIADNCIEYVKSKIRGTKYRAIELARKLKYPKNCYEWEQFDVYYPGDSALYERPLNQPAIKTVEEMLAMASVMGKSAHYTYGIDGEYDKNQKKIK